MDSSEDDVDLSPTDDLLSLFVAEFEKVPEGLKSLISATYTCTDSFYTMGGENLFSLHS